MIGYKVTSPCLSWTIPADKMTRSPHDCPLMGLLKVYGVISKVTQDNRAACASASDASI